MASKARWAATALVMAAAGCGEGGGGGGPVTPVEAPLRIEVAAGDDQPGVAGEALAAPLIVRVTRNGAPVPNASVTFSASAGTVEPTSATTNVEGRADARWILPNDEASLSTARVVARLAAGTPADSVVFTARRPLPHEMDLVLAPGLSVRMLVYDAGLFSANRFMKYAFTDSLQLRVREATQFDEMAAFAPGHAPLLVLPAWSTGRDTIRLQFKSDVIRIPMTIWVVQPPFDSTAKLVEMHLQKVAETWEAQARIGLRDVKIVDATGFAEAHRFQGTGLTICDPEIKTAIGWEDGRINAFYIGQSSLNGTVNSGAYCNGGWIEIPPLAWERPPFTTLAHEIGHGFLGGWHESPEENLMYFRAGGGKLNEGQMFRAHYSANSLLNTMFGAYPVPLRRPCSQTPGVTESRCPPTDMIVD